MSLKIYKKIPGTIVFDAEMAAKGYHLNQFCMSLMKADNRKEFRADEAAYLKKWPMTDEQAQCILNRDYNGMIALGGNIYFLAKIFSFDELSFQHAAADMTNTPIDEYKEMMIKGGRSPQGNMLDVEAAVKANESKESK